MLTSSSIASLAAVPFQLFQSAASITKKKEEEPVAELSMMLVSNKTHKMIAVDEVAELHRRRRGRSRRGGKVSTEKMRQQDLITTQAVETTLGEGNVLQSQAREAWLETQTIGSACKQCTIVLPSGSTLLQAVYRPSDASG